MPWLLNSGINLIEGNRQYLAFGLIVMLFSSLSKGNKRFGLFRMRHIIFIITGIAFLFIVQFARDTYNAGRQDANFFQLFGIQPVGDNLITNNYLINSACVSIYAYYGVEFCSLSATIDNKVTYGKPLMNNFPLVYKYLFYWNDKQAYYDESVAVTDGGSVYLGAFSHIWATMFAGFYTEYGYISLFLYPIILMIMMYIMKKYYIKSHFGQSMLLVFALSTTAYGVEFLVFNEHFSYLYGLLLILPIKSTLVNKAFNSRAVQL